jgi:hypothetical protein
MLPELYRSFETSTLKDLVSYGDLVDEEPTIEGWDPRDVEASPRRRPRGHGRSALRRKRAKWLRLNRPATARTGPR